MKTPTKKVAATIHVNESSKNYVKSSFHLRSRHLLPSFKKFSTLLQTLVVCGHAKWTMLSYYSRGHQCHCHQMSCVTTIMIMNHFHRSRSHDHDHSHVSSILFMLLAFPYDAILSRNPTLIYLIYVIWRGRQTYKLPL